MSDFKVTVSAELDPNSLANIRSALQKEKFEVDVGVNTKNIQAAARQISSEFSRVTTKNPVQAWATGSTQATKKYVTELQRLSQMNTMQKWMSKHTQAAEQYNTSLDRMTGRLSNTKKAMTKAEFDMIRTQYKKIQTKSFQEGLLGKPVVDKYVTELSRLTKAESIQKWANNNTKAMKKYGSEISNIISQYNNLDKQMTQSESNALLKQYSAIKGQARQSGLLGLTFGDKMKNAWQKFGEWGLATGAITSAVHQVREAVTEIKGIDSILTEISKTSDLSTAQLESLGKSSFQTASKYGLKASNYLTGVQEMYRAGFKNAEPMAELSVLAQSAGDMDANLANDYLMATNAAYKYKGNVEDLNKVLDSQNYITNNAAISMTDIADATSKTASVAHEYGVEIDELSALIATATKNTRKSGSEVGTALKSIMINMQDTTSKPVTDTFDALGISMTKFENGVTKLKTPIELLHELADVYNSLPEGDIMRSTILNEIGQKRHANYLAAILGDMEGYQEMLDLYRNPLAQGSAWSESQKSANNLEGSLNRLSNTWTSTINNLTGSDMMKSGVNMLNGILGVVNSITGAFGGFKTMLPSLGVGLMAGIKNFGKPKMFGLYNLLIN